MKGVRFYEVYRDKWRRVPAGNVIATFPDMVYISYGQAAVSCVAPIFTEPDSPVCGDAVSFEYLRTYCKRISEKRAAEIHPKLMEYLK